MHLIQVVIGLILTGIMIMAFFILAWYVALPILLLMLVMGGIARLRLWWLVRQAEKATNGCEIRQTNHTPQGNNKSEIIDVDFTEV